MSNLTYNDLKAMADKILRDAPPREPGLLDFLYRPPRLMGMDVYEEPPPPPKLQLRDITLSDGTKLFTPEFRTEMNAWLIERFGFCEPLLKDKVLFLTRNAIMIGPQYAGMIRNLGA